MAGRNPFGRGDRRRLFGRALVFDAARRPALIRGCSSMRDLAQLILATSVSAAFVAASYVGLTIAAGLFAGQRICRGGAALLDRRYRRRAGACAIRALCVERAGAFCHCRWKRSCNARPCWSR